MVCWSDFGESVVAPRGRDWVERDASTALSGTCASEGEIWVGAGNGVQ